MKQILWVHISHLQMWLLSSFINLFSYALQSFTTSAPCVPSSLPFWPFLHLYNFHLQPFVLFPLLFSLAVIYSFLNPPFVPYTHQLIYISKRLQQNFNCSSANNQNKKKTSERKAKDLHIQIADRWTEMNWNESWEGLLYNKQKNLDYFPVNWTEL